MKQLTPEITIKPNIDEQAPERLEAVMVACIAYNTMRDFCTGFNNHCRNHEDAFNYPIGLAEPWVLDEMIKRVEFYRDNPTATAVDGQNEWLKEKEGWWYGEEVNTYKKQHPCYCGFDELREQEQLREELFVSVCRALLMKARKIDSLYFNHPLAPKRGMK